MTKRTLKSLVPRLTKYVILTTPCTQVLATLGESVEALQQPSMRTVAVVPQLVAAVERGRPGYGVHARTYLDGGHLGYAIEAHGAIIAIGWMFVNTGDTTVRVKRRFPVPPQSALFHAAWVHPHHRGKGLQRVLLYHRARLLSRHHGNSLRIITYVETRNQPSLRNLSKSGFELDGRLWSLQVWRFCLSWRKRARSH